MTKIPGSEARSVSHWYGSADPDPYENVTDPQHWCEQWSAEGYLLLTGGLLPVPLLLFLLLLPKSCSPSLSTFKTKKRLSYSPAAVHHWNLSCRPGSQRWTAAVLPLLILGNYSLSCSWEGKEAEQEDRLLEMASCVASPTVLRINVTYLEPLLKRLEGGLSWGPGS